MDNEIRRLKTKIYLFEQEGFNWVLGDLMKDFGVSDDDIVKKIVDMYKKYKIQLDELEPKDSKQQKLWQ